MRKILAVFSILLMAYTTFSQKATISGFITDAKSGEKLIGANVYNSKTLVGSTTNAYGFYSITLNTDTVLLTVSYVGYATHQQKVILNTNFEINIELKPTIEISEVVVQGEAKIGGVESTQMSYIELPIKTIQNLPVLLGETDLIKSIQLLPGVQSGSEGMSGMYVRGGGPDQNLILLDGVPVYNVSHLFGFFSVFNGDAIQTASLVKGGFPARYGGRLSSVLDISMKEGNKKEFKGTASIGLISSKLAIEGPIGEKTSYVISGRRTYIDILTYPFQAKQEKELGYDKYRTGYYFYDLNAKINHKVDDKNHIYLSSYLGKDRFYSKTEETIDQGVSGSYTSKDNTEFWWGNITTALRWNHRVSNKLFTNTTVTYSRYKLLTGYDSQTSNNNSDIMEYSSGINDIAAKIDVDYFASPNHSIKFGASNTYHTFNPGILALSFSDADEYIGDEFGNTKIYGNESALYFEDDIRIGSLIKFNAGLRLAGFSVKNEFYHSIEPRISTRLLLSKDWSIKAAYANMNQYINLLASSGIGLPFDIWVPSTDLIKPQKANQFALGTAYKLLDQYDISIEGFYKKMDNLVEYKEGATFLSIEDDWEEKVTQGQGWSYGLEFLIMKKYGKATGWIGYTWSKSDRQFNTPGEEISEGKVFPYKYDRRHDISLVLAYKLKDNIDMGLTWVFGTGNATTLGLQEYPRVENSNNGIYGTTITHYEHRNNYRMPSYHRLDLGINFHKQKTHWKRTWNISVYNAYNRQNPFFLEWHNDFQEEDKKLMQISIFPIIPSVTYKIEF